MSTKLSLTFKSILAVGAISSVVAAAGVMNPESDLLGLASGKKVKKEKVKKDDSLMSDLVQELNASKNKPVTPPPPAAQPQTPNLNLQEQVDLTNAAPQGPLLDKVDPVACGLNSFYDQGSALHSEQYVHGQVRVFHIDSRSNDDVCRFEVYPDGCEQSYQFLVFAKHQDSPAGYAKAEQLCETVRNAALNDKRVWVHSDKYLQHESLPVEQNVVNHVSFMQYRNMEDFKSYVGFAKIQAGVGAALGGIASGIGSAAANAGRR